MEKINNYKIKFPIAEIERLSNFSYINEKFLSNNINYENFDWTTYIILNKGLQFIKNKDEAWDHWIKNQKNKNIFFCTVSDSEKSKMTLITMYENFDWKYYVEYYNEVSKKNIHNKLDAWKYLIKDGIQKNHFFFMTCPKEEITYENFDWVTYITLNEDLKHMNRNQSWFHWTKSGHIEDRPYSRINNTCIHRARFGNLFFINMAFHFIAMKNNLKVTYKYHDKFKKLGICFFVGEKTYEKDSYLSDSVFLPVIQSNKKLEKNIVIDINHFFCQTKEFCFFIKKSFDTVFKESVIKNNIFNERYKNNNDVFLHIRLGDVKNELHKNSTLEYYNKILSNMSFENGFISSDTIDDDICKYLIEKYNLQIINYCEESTIMFASTCKKILLSGGTFSWLIGFLAFYSDEIYYPKRKTTWYDDIFVFDEWTSVTIDD